MKYPDYPVALGVIRSVEDEIVYDQAVEKQVEEVKAQSKIHCVDDLLHSGATWEIYLQDIFEQSCRKRQLFCFDNRENRSAGNISKFQHFIDSHILIGGLQLLAPV